MKNEPELMMGPIKEALGDEHPELTPTALGRYRLVQSLRHRFGENWKNIAKARKAIEHFDKELDYFRRLRKIRGVSHG